MISEIATGGQIQIALNTVLRTDRHSAFSDEVEVLSSLVDLDNLSTS